LIRGLYVDFVKAFWSRLGACIACFGGGMAASIQNLPAEEIGLVGAKLSGVQTTDDFFVFFNFAPIGEEKLPGGAQVTSFKPTGDAFKALVTLAVTTDAQGTITKLDLTVARSFIDDPKKCIYAADLVKSFLTKAAATSDADEVGSLAREISARSTARSTMKMITAQPLPQPPATISAAYQTYAGNPQPQTLVYRSGKLQVLLRNDTQAGIPVLDLIVSPKP
jgi:hypothetical protein